MTIHRYLRFSHIYRGLLVLGLLALTGCESASEIPAIRLERAPFIHRVTCEGTLRAKKAVKILIPSGVRRRVRIAWLEREGALLNRGDLVARLDSQELELQLEDSLAELEAASFRTEKSQADGQVRVAKHESELALAQLDLEFARRYQKLDGDLFSRREIIESRIDEALAEARKIHTSEMAEIQRSLNQAELELLGIDGRQASMTVGETRSGLMSLEIRAPYAGILNLSRNYRGEIPAIGTDMWQGHELGEIPSLKKMEAEVYVLEADAGGIAVGQPASVVIESHPEVLIDAEVTSVDALARPRFEGSPVQYFGVVLKLKTNSEVTLKPGQRVVATLFLERLEDALVLPRQAVFSRGENFWVYRRIGRHFKIQSIQLGSSSAGLMVVAEGLSEGDVVALKRPDGAEIHPSDAGGLG